MTASSLGVGLGREVPEGPKKALSKAETELHQECRPQNRRYLILCSFSETQGKAVASDRTVSPSSTGSEWSGHPACPISTTVPDGSRHLISVA